MKIMTTVFPGFNSSKIQVRAGPTARTRTDVDLSAEPIPAVYRIRLKADALAGE
jgi:hypothetical protein